jgi:hypothetical protein
MNLITHFLQCHINFYLSTYGTFSAAPRNSGCKLAESILDTITELMCRTVSAKAENRTKILLNENQMRNRLDQLPRLNSATKELL